MYSIIIEKKCKKQPYRSRVYKKINWSPYSWDPLQGTWVGEDEIPREAREKWDIVLNHSFREAGQTKKVQWHVQTVTFWQIVEGWHFENIHCGIERYLRIRMIESLDIDKEELAKEKNLPAEDRIFTNLAKEKWSEFQESLDYSVQYETIYKLVYGKFQPIIDQVGKEYKKSEEYLYKTLNEQAKKAKENEIKREKEYQDAKATNDSVFGSGYYDCHYNKDGSSKCYSAEAKEWDRTHKKRESKSSYSNYSSGFNFEFGKSASFSGSEKAMAEELIIAGYKALAKKYHPDTGGSNEAFQELGGLKDKLLELIKK